jgi:hypothetical protein
MSCKNSCNNCVKKDDCIIRHILDHADENKEKNNVYFDFSSHKALIRDILCKIAYRHSLFNMISSWNLVSVGDSADGLGWRVRHLIDDGSWQFAGEHEKMLRKAYGTLGAAVYLAINEICDDRALCKKCLITGACFLERKM